MCIFRGKSGFAQQRVHLALAANARITQGNEARGNAGIARGSGARGNTRITQGNEARGVAALGVVGAPRALGGARCIFWANPDPPLFLKKRAGAPGPRVHGDRSDIPVQKVWGDHSAEPSGKLTDERHLAGPGMHVHISAFPDPFFQKGWEYPPPAPGKKDVPNHASHSS